MADLRGYVEGLIGFEGDGTNVEANPTGTPTDTLETIQIGDVIYSIDGGGEEIVPTPTNADRGKFLVVKSNANELEYRSINELPSSEEVSVNTVLTHTISGDKWLPPIQELPTYTSDDNGKVLGVSSGALAWVEQSGGGGGDSYSSEEQVVGTWIDGKTLYQKTFIWNETITGDITKSILLDNPDYVFIYNGSGINSGNAYIPLPYVHYNNANSIGLFISSTKDSIGFRLGSSISLLKSVITVRYTKNAIV